MVRLEKAQGCRLSLALGVRWLLLCLTLWLVGPDWSSSYVRSGLKRADAQQHDLGSDESLNTNPLTATVEIKPSRIPPGGNGEVVISMELAPGFHAYLDKFKLAVLSDPPIKVGGQNITPLVEFHDTVTKKMKRGIEKRAILTSSIEIPEEYPLREEVITFLFTYQACTKEFCLFPQTLKLEAPLVVGPIDQLEPSNQVRPTGELLDQSLQDQIQKGLFFALLFVFVAGFLTSLTPCVYPMIPITLAILGARSSQQRSSQWRGFFLSLVYVLGIATTYSLLGLLAANAGVLVGSQLSSKWIVFPMAALFFAMGLSMYGVFEIQAPQWVRHRLGRGSTGAGFLGAYGAGLIAGVVAGPCVGPVLVSILTYVGQTKNSYEGFLFLFVFAMGLGLPFIALGTFSSLTSKIPKAGPWMRFVNFIFGTSMLVVALYFVRPLISDHLFALLCAATLLFVSVFFGAFRTSKEGELKALRHRLLQSLLILLFFTGIGLSVLSLREDPFDLFWDNSQRTQHSESWKAFSDELLERARQNHQSVIIDFRADWCAACLELEAYTFSHPEVVQRTENFVLLRVDATHESEEITVLQQRFSVVGLPTILFFDSSGELRKELTLTGFESAAEFLKRLDGLESKSGLKPF